MACSIFIAARRLCSWGTWALECEGSVVAVHGLCCFSARGILVPRPGIKPLSPALQDVFLTTGPPGKSLLWFLEPSISALPTFTLFKNLTSVVVEWFLWLKLCSRYVNWTDGHCPDQLYKGSLWSKQRKSLIRYICVCGLCVLSPTLCDPMDCSPPGSSVHGSLQAKILEWHAISSSQESSQPRIKPASPAVPALQADSLPLSHLERPDKVYTQRKCNYLHCKLDSPNSEVLEDKRVSQVVLVVKNPPASAGDIRDTGSIPGSGRSPGGRHGNPLQYSYLENPMDRGAWRATVQRIMQSWTRLKQLSMHACTPAPWWISIEYLINANITCLLTLQRCLW